MLGLAAFSLLRALPSTDSAEACASLFASFIGTTAQSDFSTTYMSGVRLLAFPDRSACADAMEISRFSCMLFLDVLGSSTTPGLTATRDVALPPILPSHRQNSVGARFFVFGAQ